MPPRSILVVGTSLAGLYACERLRSEGFTGAIGLVGAEDRLPYDRPPLSKKLLTGEWEPERIALRKPDDYAGLGLDLRLGVPAQSLDPETRTLTLADGTRLSFDGLVVATGAAPRKLPHQPLLQGIHTLRTIDDALALRADLAAARRVVVVGAGFIGLEVAAAARRHGCEVVVLEAAPAPLMRALGGLVGAAVAAVAIRHGVRLRCNVQVGAIHGASHVEAVELADGEMLAADCVVVGVGAAPSVGWLESSGLRLDNGIVCDETLCTGVPGIYAAGDCVNWPNPLFDRERMRVEHWTNAAEQGALAAANLLACASGAPQVAYSPVPYVWSDLFDSRVQILGRPADADQVLVLASADKRGLLALYGHRGRLRAAAGVNAMRPLRGFRVLVAQPDSWATALARSESLDGFVATALPEPTPA
jgi:NADPH-dependent 2,4-dienoyl-CoA reductase/sulfur reductase-like enzyme